MYIADATTISYLTDGSREYDCKIEVYDGGVFSTTILQSDGTIYPFVGDSSIQTSDFFTIGSIHSAGLKIPLDISLTIPKNAELRLFFRLNGTSGYGDWIPMGAWFVDNRFPSGDNVMVYQCYDEMVRAESTYVSALTYPTTAQAVWDEIISQLGLTSSVSLASKTITAAISGDTHRTTLGDIAGLYGGSVVIDRDYEVDIVYPYQHTTSTLTIDTDVWDGFERIGEDVRTISRVTCIYNINGDYITLGDDTGYEMIFYSRLIRSTADLQEVFDNYDGITFVPYNSLSWIGDPRVDVGDRVTIVDKDNVTTYDTFIMTTTFKYGGGLSMTNTSTVYSETESEFDVNYGLNKFIRNTVKQGVPYYGVTINTEYGINISRSDGFSETTINSDTWEVFVEGVKKLYIDFTEGEMIFDGKLTADVIEAVETVIASNLTAGKAYIAELTVDSINTSDAVQNYLNTDSSDIDYFIGQDEEITWYTASTTGTTTVQVSNRNSELLYWIDDTYTGSSTEVTAYPVLRYEYTELIKANLGFEIVDGTRSVVFQLGAGTGVGNNGKVKLYKGVEGFEINYYSSVDGDLRQIKFTDEGINITPSILSFVNVQNDTEVSGSSLIMDSLSVTANQFTAVSFDLQLDVTASAELYMTVEIRDNGTVVKSTKKKFYSATDDNMSFVGLLPKLSIGDHTIDAVITSSTGTITVPIEGYELLLEVQDGITDDVPPYPVANVYEYFEIKNLAYSIIGNWSDDVITTDPTNLVPAPSDTFNMGDIANVAWTDGVTTELT